MSGEDLALANGASKSDSLAVGCGRKRSPTNKCWSARVPASGRPGGSPKKCLMPTRNVRCARPCDGRLTYTWFGSAING